MKTSIYIGALVAPLLLLRAAPRSSPDVPKGLAPAFDTPRQILRFPSDGHLNSIRIVTWNIDRGAALSTIASELQQNPADLLLLQEVDWNAARSGHLDIANELASRLQLNASYGIEFEELGQGDQAYIGQATLTRLPIKTSRVLRFHSQSGFWKPHSWIPSSMPLLQRRLGSRIALITELQFAGRPLLVYNLHLESRSAGHLQLEQLDEVLADIAQYPPGTSVIIGGDLNTKYFPSLYLHKLEKAGFHSATGRQIERTHEIMMTLDWIFARGILIEEGRVRRDLKGSDHYPIYADLKAR